MEDANPVLQGPTPSTLTPVQVNIYIETTDVGVTDRVVDEREVEEWEAEDIEMIDVDTGPPVVF